MDPTIARFYKFIVLYTRLVIIMFLSFFAFKDEKNFADLDDAVDNAGTQGLLMLVVSIVFSIILVPIPINLFFMFRDKYYLN